MLASTPLCSGTLRVHVNSAPYHLVPPSMFVNEASYLRVVCECVVAGIQMIHYFKSRSHNSATVDDVFHTPATGLDYLYTSKVVARGMGNL